MPSFRTPSQRNKLISLATIWFISAGLGTLVYLTHLLAPVERLALDRKFLLFQREYERNDIALIAIDASSLDRLSRDFHLHWPWPRELYGMMLEFLDSAGSKTVTFDVLLDRPDIDRIDTEGPVSDRRFAETVYNSGNVILAANSIQTPAAVHHSAGNQPTSTDLTGQHPGFPHNLDRHFIPLEDPHPSIPHVTPVNLPIMPLRYAARRLGNAYVPTRHDGVIRSTYLLMPLDVGNSDPTDQIDEKDGTDETDVNNNSTRVLHFPSLPMAAWLAGLEEQPSGVIEFRDSRLHISQREIPLLSDGTYRINWYARGGVHDGTFPYYSFYDVFRSGLAVIQNRPEMAPLQPDLFADRHIVIGASAAGLADIKTTPFSAIEPYPGMEIQATVLANLLDGSFIREMSTTVVLILLWIFLIPVIFGIGTLRHVNSILLALAVPAAIVISGLTVFALYRFVMPTVFFTASSLIGIGTTYVFRYLTEERQKKAMKSAFSQYVQREFVDRIADDPDQLKLGGQQKELTVLFSDMANFTSISETLSPGELSSFLNDYLTDMTRIVFEYGGTVDKFIGDAVMAFWGAPIDQPDHALRACRCALAMQRRLEERADEWKNMGYPPVSIRIGINTGPMIVGNMGSKDRFNYTVLGDAVNLGARLEPLNKQYDTKVIVSEFTRNALPGDPHDTGPKIYLRKLDRITVKGKTHPVTIYELLDG